MREYDVRKNGAKEKRIEHSNQNGVRFMKLLEESAVTNYVLCKHHLLSGYQAENALQAVNDIIALHATSVGTTYISLFARVKKFRRNHLDKELYQKRNLLRLRAMRGTLFITSLKSAPMLFQATKLPEGQLFRMADKWGITRSEYHELSERLQAILKGEAKTLSQIRKAIPREMVRTIELREGKSVYRRTNVKWILSVMMRLGWVISEKEAGSLRLTKANRYALFKEIYPNLNLNSVGSEEARTTLVKRYIQAFGPVVEGDITWWTGFRKTNVTDALKTMEEELLLVKTQSSKEDYLMLRDDYAQFARFKPSKTHSTVLLPYEDPYTKGYNTKRRLIDSEYEKQAYVGGGVQPTILLDGRIAGTWNRNIEEGKEPIQLRFFAPPEKDVEKEVVRQAKAIGRLMAGREVRVESE